jgi:glycosyltransferase involved in cell wall biosynthesis
LIKIGIIAFSEDSSGGIYQYTQSIVDALKNDNKNKYIIFCNESDKRFDNYNLEVRKLKVNRNNFIQRLFMALQLLFLIRKPFFFKKDELETFKDIDLFISPTISAYPHFYLNKAFIFTLHDMQERHYPNFFSKYERFSRWLRNRALAKSAVKIICESTYVKNDIVKFVGISEDKISIIKSPPPEEFLNYSFNEAIFEKVRNKYNLPQKYIFYPAQCWFHKNHIKLVEAFKIVSQKYDDIHLVLTGSQKNNYKNLLNRIDSLGLNDKVHHLGYIDYEDLPYLYKMSMMLVMPSLFESVSIPIYEAFSLSVPVCSSNVVALPEQVGDGGLLFDPKDINDMAKKMLSYIEDNELAKIKSQIGNNSIKSFNHKAYSDKLKRVIDYER